MHEQFFHGARDQQPSKRKALPTDTFRDEEFPDDLRVLVQHYAAQPVPRPSSADTIRLLTRLVEEGTTVAASTPLGERHRLLQIVSIVRWRLYLLGPWFWGAGMFLLISLLFLALFQPAQNIVTILIMLMPLVTILGLTHALHASAGGLREIEASSPSGFVEEITGLVLALIIGNSLVGIVVSLAVSLIRWISFGALLISWLGPLLLLSAISLPIALRWGTKLAALVGGGPWLLLAGITLMRPQSLISKFFLLPQNGLSLAIHLVFALFGGLILIYLFAYGSQWQRILTPSAGMGKL